tara:strand:- start:19 stop:582 length:564 start_codon:yes stop_codon:yes gene_type:complete
MSNPIEELMKKGDTPGVSIRSANVVNPQHPGYFEPIGARNIGQENLTAMGLTPEMQQLAFDMATGSGAPMAIGSIAKGGGGLLQRILSKFKGKKTGKVTAASKVGGVSIEDASKWASERYGTGSKLPNNQGAKVWKQTTSKEPFKDMEKEVNKWGLQYEVYGDMHRYIEQGYDAEDAFSMAFSNWIK